MRGIQVAGSYAFAMLACGVCLFSRDSIAQSPNPKTLTRFEIGADFVNPSHVYPWAWTPITSVDDFTADTSFIPNLVRVGLSLANIHVRNAGTGWTRDLAARMGDNGIRVSLHDDTLMAASRWERRYFQVEDDSDFTHNNAGFHQTQDFFKTDNLRFDLHPRNYRKYPAPFNGIRFRDGVDQNDSVWAFTQRHSLYINGRYYITIRMGIPSDYNSIPSNDQEPCLLLRMQTDSMMMEWQVPGEAFYENGNVRTGQPIEYIPRTSTGQLATIVLRAVPARNVCWFEHEDISTWGMGSDSCEVDYPAYGTRYLLPPGTPDSCGFGLTLQYLGRGDIFVDAICFSDPQGYGFFVGDDNALPNFRGHALRDQIQTRLQNLGVSGVHNNNLAFLELQEAGPGAGCLTTMNLITQMIDEITGTNDTINTFNRLAYGEEMHEKKMVAFR